MNYHRQVNGNEAVALAAISSGIDYFSHYPGSPVNFVEPALRKYVIEFKQKVIFNDALNEHIATLAAGGASFTGARSLVVMKHVGMNIAADPLTYLAYTGVKGGMVLVVGTDPGANASTGEPDMHWYARMCNLPLFEPVTVKEIYRLCREAFIVSEKYHLPVLIFIPVRLAYDSEIIEFCLPETKDKAQFFFEKNKELYINVGQRNIRNHKNLLQKVKQLAVNEKYVKVFGNSESSKAILTRGLSFAQVFECLTELKLWDEYMLINLDLVFPLPEDTLSAYLGQKSEILVIEDQDGFLEEQLKMRLFNSLDATISGKENFSVWGELNLEMVEEFFRNKHNFPDKESFLPALELQIPERLGTFCEGCPHRTVFFVLDKIIKELPGIIGGDIGCSSLPPFRADWLMCMNAGIGISQGISHLNNGQIVFSTGGDGSFFHAGLLSLQSAVINKINLIHLVLDNKSVAMTGHQQSPTANKKFKARKLLKSIGVDRVYRLKATQVKKLEKIIRKEAFGQGVRVLWIDGQCSRLSNKFRDFKIKTIEPKIKNFLCGDCRVCYSEFACPAIIQISEKEGPEIDLNTCMRCGACKEVCPEGAIGISYLDAIKNLLKIR